MAAQQESGGKISWKLPSHYAVAALIGEGAYGKVWYAREP